MGKQKTNQQNRFKPKFHLKKGDEATVIAGEDKGKRGRVLRIFPKSERAIVEGVNIVSRHTKPNAQNPQGGIVRQEGSIHMSNLMLVDPKSGNITRVGRRVDGGKIVRYAKKTGEVID